MQAVESQSADENPIGQKCIIHFLTFPTCYFHHHVQNVYSDTYIPSFHLSSVVLFIRQNAMS